MVSNRLHRPVIGRVRLWSSPVRFGSIVSYLGFFNDPLNRGNGRTGLWLDDSRGVGDDRRGFIDRRNQLSGDLSLLLE